MFLPREGPREMILGNLSRNSRSHTPQVRGGLCSRQVLSRHALKGPLVLAHHRPTCVRSIAYLMPLVYRIAVFLGGLHKSKFSCWPEFCALLGPQ